MYYDERVQGGDFCQLMRVVRLVQARSGEASPAAGDEEERQAARSQVRICDKALVDACEEGYCAYTEYASSRLA